MGFLNSEYCLHKTKFAYPTHYLIFILIFDSSAVNEVKVKKLSV